MNLRQFRAFLAHPWRYAVVFTLCIWTVALLTNVGSRDFLTTVLLPISIGAVAWLLFVRYYLAWAARRQIPRIERKLNRRFANPSS